MKHTENTNHAEAQELTSVPEGSYSYERMDTDGVRSKGRVAVMRDYNVGEEFYGHTLLTLEDNVEHKKPVTGKVESSPIKSVLQFPDGSIQFTTITDTIYTLEPIDPEEKQKTAVDMISNMLPKKMRVLMGMQ